MQWLRFRAKSRRSSQNFLRSARPAEAAIAKVFAKIRQKILFCKFFGRAGRMGTSRTTSCQNFSLERPLAVAKTSKKRKRKIGIFYDFGIQFFMIFDRFWRSQLFSDVKIEFLEVFRFRWSNFQVCTTLGAHFWIFHRPYIAPWPMARGLVIRAQGRNTPTPEPP